MTPERFAAWLLDADRRPLVMGVLNVTPDSFSDGGRFAETEAAIEQARRMVEAGADLIDIGGESTRPGSQRVPADEQLRRVLPVIRSVAASLPVVISVDTTLTNVAAAALDAGACLVNDISAGRDDPGMFALIASCRVPVILMHMLGEPATMQDDPDYPNDDVVTSVGQFLRERHDAAVAAGIRSENILFDPGIGFGKTTEHNLTLLRETRRLAELGHALVVGASRKRFIGTITGEPDPAKRLFGTAAAVAWSITNGAAIVRVHDVGPMTQVVRMVQAIRAP
jgi:dihydropteroate synthase